MCLLGIFLLIMSTLDPTLCGMFKRCFAVKLFICDVKSLLASNQKKRTELTKVVLVLHCAIILAGLVKTRVRESVELVNVYRPENEEQTER